MTIVLDSFLFVLLFPAKTAIVWVMNQVIILKLQSFLIRFMCLIQENIQRVQKVKSEYQSLSHVQLFVTPWTITLQAPLSMGFPNQNTRVGSHFLLQRIFPTQGSKPCLSALAGGYFTVSPGKHYNNIVIDIFQDFKQSSFSPPASF